MFARNAVFRDANRDLRAVLARHRRVTKRVADEPPNWRVWSDARGQQRLVVGVTTTGCSYARTPFGGCSICGHRASTLWRSSAEDVETLESVAVALSAVDDLHSTVVSLYCSGSLLDPAEISRPTLRAIFDLVGSRQPAAVLIESLPGFITHETAAFVRSALNAPVTISTGMDASCGVLRSLCVAKDFTNGSYRRASLACLASGIRPAAYVSLGLPFLTPNEAVAELVRAIRTAVTLGFVEVSVEPIALQAGTIQELFFKQGTFETPTIWWIVSALAEFKGSGITSSCKLIVGGQIFTPLPSLPFAACQDCINSASEECPAEFAQVLAAIPPTRFGEAECCARTVPAAKPISLQRVIGRVRSFVHSDTVAGHISIPS